MVAVGVLTNVVLLVLGVKAAIALARAASVRVLAITVLDPKHAAQQSHGLLAEQHHDVSPSERGVSPSAQR